MAAGFMAGSVIGKLVLDKTKWSQSVNDVKKDEKTLGGMSDRTSAKFRKVGTAMTIAGAAIVGGLSAMIKKYVEAGDEIGKMAKRTGFAVTTLGELKYAADITGASFTDIEKATKRMGKTISDAGDGMATYVRAFDKLGISVEDLSKLGIEEQFFAIGDAISKIEQPFMRSAAAQDIFGRAGTKLLPLFDEGEEGLKKLREQAHELGIVFEDTSAAEKLKDVQGDLGKAFSGLSFTIAEQLVPSVTTIITKITEVVKKFTAWSKAHPGLSSALTKALALLGGLLTVLGPIVILLPSMVKGVKLLGVAFKGALGPIGLITTAIVAAGAALNAWINARKKAMDQEMDAMVADKTLANMHELRRVAIEKGILTQEEWSTEVNKFGKDYKAFLTAVSTAPEYETLRGELEDITKSQEDTGDATDDLGTDYDTLLGQIQGTNEKMKTWVDYLKDNAILTIKEKSDRIQELEGYLDDLETAYEDGKISVEDYNTAQQAAHDELVELGGASKTYYDHLKDMGIPTLTEVDEKLGDVETKLGALETAYENGEISQKNYETGVKNLETAIENVTADAIIWHGKLLKLGEDFDALVPKARDMTAVMDDIFPKVISDTEEFERESFETATATESKWSEVTDGIKTKWTTEFSAMLLGTQNFAGLLEGVWGTIKTQFADMVSAMVTKWIFGFIEKLVSSAAEGATSIASSLGKALGGGEGADIAGGLTSITGAVSSVVNPINMVTGAITAVASVLQLFKKPGGPSTTDSWHFQETWKVSKEERDWHFINHQARLDETVDGLAILATKSDTTRKVLHRIRDNTAATVKAIRKITPKAAQFGYVSKGNEFIETHGTPSSPEYILRKQDLSRLINIPKTAPAGPVYHVDFSMPVTLQGTIITDRDYARNRFMPEFLAALKATVGKSELKEVLGIP